MTVDVSVVIPLYNPGRTMDVCIEGMLAQTIDPSRIELIFVDDGSTDGGAELVDDLATQHVNISAFHQANSGHPGGPRNIGIEAAVGEYVFFCDHDDWLEPEAFERLVAHARRTGADVVIPKMTGHRRVVPWMLFRETVDDANPEVVPVMNALTPHKLFRRQFLLDHQIRFPERVRLEDHVFMAESYLQATTITVAADYPYFHHPRQDDGANISLSRPIEPVYYYSCVDRTLNVIERLTEPGPRRNAFLIRPYATEMLARLEGASLLNRDPEVRDSLVDEIRTRALSRFPADFHHQLPALRQVSARAMLAGDRDGLERLAAAWVATEGRFVVQSLTATGSSYRVTVDGELVFKDDRTPVRFVRADGGWHFDERLVPRELAPEAGSESDITLYVLDVMLRHRETRVEWFLPVQSTTVAVQPIEGDDAADRVVVSCTATIDPATLAGGTPLQPGPWDLFVRLNGIGLERNAGGKFEVGAGFELPGPIGRVTPRHNPNNGRVVIGVKAEPVAPTPPAPPTAPPKRRRRLFGKG